MGADVRFPHLGIVIESLGKTIHIGDFTIAYYGVIIAFGMIMGFLLASWQGTRIGQDKEIFLDLTLWDIVFAIIGARLYYVLFSWDYYSQHPMEILNIRGGGMAIYGGVIAGVITTFVFAKIRKVSVWQLLDAACGGLLIGQIIGRWGNFFNREAFGGYTDGLFAMQLKRSQVRAGDITSDILNHLVTIDGVEYIQVHPTFLYESLWNLALLLIILLYTRKRKFEGQLFFMYLFGYGLGRVWIEGLRTDQLKLFGTPIAVSQLLSGILVVVSGSVLLYQWGKRLKQNKVSPMSKKQ
ncbi:MAG: prolipoprotein diacylglyceryl transferase [Butyribacter sp.]|nr:prolipoprotein diacylglyceryl transferase [bacterium]MDY3855155.1 prolipoprotein diacylglyceryl transferase [Butyribacter sp.]